MTPMRRKLMGGLAALALTAGAGALGGCGSQSRPASVASAPAGSQSTPTETAATTTATSTSTTTTATSPSAGSTPAPTSTAGGTGAPGTTRTAPEPAFTESEHHVEGLKEAVATVQGQGYTPNETAQYHPNQTLRVLVGTKSSDGDEQQAFFFVDGRYIGTDAREPSGAIEVVAQSDTEVTLAYALYRPQDPPGSPSGGRATVRFALNDGKLMALEAIPPASSSTGLSRR